MLVPVLLREALERHGLTFAVTLGVHDGAISLGCQWSGRQDNGLAMLRAAVALADDATCAALEAQVERLCALGSLHHRACALVFAHRADWAAELADAPPQWWERLLHGRSEALPALLAEVGLLTASDHFSSHLPEGASA